MTLSVVLDGITVCVTRPAPFLFVGELPATLSLFLFLGELGLEGGMCC